MTARRWRISTRLGALAEDHPVDQEKDHRADNRENESGGLAFLIPTHRPPEEGSEERAGDAEQNGDNATTGIPSGHEELRDDANN